jgi:hypothetical protein
MTFLLAEDEALRKKLQGMTVSDQKSEGQDVPRQVSVWFGQPDQEIRAQSFPYITIDMIDIQRDTAREMRGLVNPDYLRPDSIDIETEDFLVDIPIPVYIDYQITTYSRHPRHDRDILAQLLTTKFPMRFGYLEIPEKSVTVGNTTTNTITLRRLDVMNVAKRDVTEQAKRLFVNAISVRVSSEVVQGLFRQLYKVQTVTVSPPSGEYADAGWDGLNEFTISTEDVTP